VAKKVEGRVEAIIVDTDHVSVHLGPNQPEDSSLSGVTVVKLYEDDLAHTVPPREGMRRGALLSLVERAFTHRHFISVEVSENDVVRTMKMWFPVWAVPQPEGPGIEKKHFDPIG
jgi:hypothetical protein